MIPSMVVRGRLLIAALLALTGIVWIFQGVGVIPGSFMTGDITWTYIGIAVLIGSAALAASALRRGSS
jgi:hypothetical protein